MKNSPEHVAALREQVDRDQRELSRVILELSRMEGKRQRLLVKAARDQAKWLEAAREGNRGRTNLTMARQRIAKQRRQEPLDVVGSWVICAPGSGSGTHLFKVETIAATVVTGTALCGEPITKEPNQGPVCGECVELALNAWGRERAEYDARWAEYTGQMSATQLELQRQVRALQSQARVLGHVADTAAGNPEGWTRNLVADAIHAVSLEMRCEESADRLAELSDQWRAGELPELEAETPTQAPAARVYPTMPWTRQPDYRHTDMDAVKAAGYPDGTVAMEGVGGVDVWLPTQGADDGTA
jgi:hypothetical protein